MLFSLPARAVDKNNFKTCDQSSFCKRNRALPVGEASYRVDPDSLSIGDHGCQMDLINSRTSEGTLRAEFYTLEGNMFRLKVKEKDGLHPRYEVEGVLVGDPKLQSCKVQRKSGGVEITSSTTKASVTYDPFQVDFYVNNEIAVVLNSRGLMNIEHLREKRVPPPPPKQPMEETDEEEEGGEGGEEEGGEGGEVDAEEVLILQGEEVDPPPPPPPPSPPPGSEEEEEGIEEELPEEMEEEKKEPLEEPGMWEETFKTHHDSKPYGPSSVGMDISFPGVEHVYGIPEHADSLALKTTNGGDPYRLYNLDVFEYELDNKMALYGSIPLMLAHNWSKTVGVFWLNAAETWIDITNAAANRNILGKLLSYFKAEEEIPQTDTHWISESGVIDLFIILGPRPYDVFRQYSSLTGTQALPPLFSLGYHQSRWNYNDENDVSNVDEGFDAHDIPYDVLWLDIEHTNGKRYLTWDTAKFPTPATMQSKLAAKGRKMVTIVDPHIKRDSGYHVHSEAEANGYYVKKSDGSSVYEGWCWPGSSSWVDFLDPAIRQWWAGMLSPQKYQGSTLDLFTWNDMNEPSVFNGPEITMHKDCRHYGNWEHRDVHNVYGMFVHQASAEGQVMRSEGKERPFVLSRAFFAGTQRFGAIWTGDNKASWDHLKASLPMILSMGVAGLTFTGADVGGFFTNPDPELLTRWYQAGAFYPFFRAHAHLDTRRREPWLFDADKTAIMRAALRLRYELLPFWYTEFYVSSVSGVPVARPLWVEFPRDKNTYNMDDQYIIGSSLLVHPVTEQYATSVEVYLPGTSVPWYDMDTHAVYNGGLRHYINSPLNKIPAFYRGGSIVPKKLRVRRASVLMADDPYTLFVALNLENEAKGVLYIDDGHSFEYKNGAYVLRNITYSDNQLSSSCGDERGKFATKSWLERVVVMGLATKPNSVTLSAGKATQVLLFKYEPSNKLLTIRKPGVNMAEDFIITVN